MPIHLNTQVKSVIFLKNKLPKLMQEEIQNINKSIVNEEISLHFTKEQTSCVMVKVLK